MMMGHNHHTPSQPSEFPSFTFQSAAASTATTDNPQSQSHHLSTSSPILLTPIPIPSSSSPISIWQPLISALSETFTLLSHHFSLFFRLSFSRFYLSSVKLLSENPLLFVLLGLPVCGSVYNYCSISVIIGLIICIGLGVMGSFDWNAEKVVYGARENVGRISKAATKRAAAIAAAAATAEKKQLSAYRWEFSSESTPYHWYPFAVLHSESIESVLLNRSMELESGKLSVVMNACSYVVDVVGMTQMNVATGKVRQLRRVKNE